MKKHISDNDEVLSQWDWDNNGDMSPYKLTIGSEKKVWWICDKGHEWKASILNRTSQKSSCPLCAGHQTVAGDNDITTTHPDIAAQWDTEKNNDISPYEVTSGSGRKVWWVCEKGHSWNARIADRKRFGCPYCAQGNTVSRREKELADYIGNILPEEDIHTSVRTVIFPYELDIYIPSHNIAIEFNGLYWHSDARITDKKYHYNKWKMCRDKDIQLITVWEDEWRDKQDIVKSMLAHKLGASQTRKVFARKTIVSTISSYEAREFLNKYHIQGYTSGTAYIGLFFNDELVAVSVWRKNKGTLYLDRYATHCTVIGGMGKLLKSGKDCARKNNCSTIVTFSDHQVSDGHLYEKLGFTFDGKIKPDYRYLVDGERKHKFGYRLKRFRTDDSLIYEEGKTEKELAHLNELDRIYDCGKTRWMMTI